MPTQPYAFDARVEEHRRLSAQSAIFDPLTERLFVAAGLRPGMRVLDLGTGAGSVAMLAARLVSPGGAVVSVDRDGAALSLAHDHARRERVTNVEFLEGDLSVPELPGGHFDAVVGRLVLMYLPDPAATLRAAALRLRPGAVVCAQEPSFGAGASVPATPLLHRMHTAIATTLDRAGADPDMGLRLHRVFAQAGLPRPELRGETVLAGGPDAPVWAWGNIARGLAPLMERLGVEGADAARSATLDACLLAELREEDGLLMSPLMVGAWATMPPG